MSSLIFLFLLSLSSSPFTFTTAAFPTYLYHECSYRHFTKNSTYQSNLNSLLSSLPSNANRSNGYYKATSGQDPSKVYGLFQCLGEITTTNTCQDCIAFASTEVTRRCPDQKEAVIWYDECLLHYSDASIIYTSGNNNGPLMPNDTEVTVEPGRFHQLMLSLMYGAATQAANDPRKFATREGNSTTSQSIYGLVQCTQDLSNTDCLRCLQEAIANLRAGRVGGRVLLPNCYCRYESYLFYNKNLIAALPPPPSETRPKGKSQFSSLIIVAVVAAIALSAVLSVAGYCFLTRRARKKYNALKHEEVSGIGITTIESLQFDFGTIQAATNRFSTDNRLGAGGFGEVYKGVLPNGQEIAVKRLSKSSAQGTKEFQNEVLLVAKLQHKNLVRLRGFCLEGEERILVYEFVSNKSLDYYLFDPKKQGQLDLSTKYKIIQGIARGILYLHEDSRLRIIHRDLKVSNILLDKDMNPKISDFGLARIFGVDQTQGNTSRIMGTYGYMSPEYAMHGKFSVKSDIYSFGVLVLEIITGKKNGNFCDTDGAKDLLSYVWKHWTDGTTMQLLDSNLTDSSSTNEVNRFIQVGLSCVQEDPAARPTMATVVLMLNSYSVTLPSPQKPAFFQGSKSGQNKQITEWTVSDKTTSKSIPWSVYDASITEVYPR